MKDTSFYGWTMWAFGVATGLVYGYIIWGLF